MSSYKISPVNFIHAREQRNSYAEVHSTTISLLKSMASCSIFQSNKSRFPFTRPHGGFLATATEDPRQSAVHSKRTNPFKVFLKDNTCPRTIRIPPCLFNDSNPRFVYFGASNFGLTQCRRSFRLLHLAAGRRANSQHRLTLESL